MSSFFIHQSSLNLNTLIPHIPTRCPAGSVRRERAPHYGPLHSTSGGQKGHGHGNSSWPRMTRDTFSSSGSRRRYLSGRREALSWYRSTPGCYSIRPLICLSRHGRRQGRERSLQYRKGRIFHRPEPLWYRKCRSGRQACLIIRFIFLLPWFIDIYNL